jgi:choline kinase
MVNKAHRHIAPAKLPHDDDRLTVIIPAAGIGKRMKSKGPKALLPVHRGMPILEHQARVILKVYPHADIIAVVGFEHHKIRKELWGQFPIRLVYNHDYATTNVLYSVSLGLDAMLPGPVMIIHGDLVFNQAMIQGLAGEASALLVSPTNCIEPDEVGMGYQDGMVTQLSYALPVKWAQIAYLMEEELELFRHTAFQGRFNQQWFLHEALNHIINKGGKFVAHKPPRGGKIVEVDKYDDLTKAKQI